MKKIFTLLTFLTFTILTQAQITLDQSDFGQAGDTVIYNVDTNVATTPAVKSGSSMMQTWDYSTDFTSNLFDTVFYLSPASTPYASDFPLATMALEEDGVYTYVVKNANEFALDGLFGDPLGVGLSFRLDYDPNLAQMRFPATLNDVYHNVAAIDTAVDTVIFFGLYDSVRVTREVRTYSEMDAYGTLILPTGTFTDVIRQMRIDTIIDSGFVHSPSTGWGPLPSGVGIPLPNYEITYTYSWFAKGQKRAILEAAADTVDGVISRAIFQLGNQLIGSFVTVQEPLCTGGSTGSISAQGLGGAQPYSYLWNTGATNATIMGLTAGTYTVTINDNGASQFVDDITINDPPALSIAVTNVTNESLLGNDGGITTITTGGTGSTSCSWTGPNGYMANTCDISGIAGGTYSCTVTDANGCTATTQSTLSSAVGLNQIIDDNKGINLYPNPVNTVQIQLTSTLDSKASVYILDLTGRTILETSILPNEEKLVDVSKFNNGTYLLHYQSENLQYSEKFTIVN